MENNTEKNILSGSTGSSDLPDILDLPDLPDLSDFPELLDNPEALKEPVANSQTKPNLALATANKTDTQPKPNPTPDTAKKTDSQPKPNSASDTAKKIDTQPKPNPAPATVIKTDSQPKSNSAPATAKKTDTQPKPNSTTDSAKKTDTQPKPNPAPATAIKTDSQPKSNSAPATTKKTDTQPKPNPAPATAIKTDSQPKSNSAPATAKKTDSQPKPNSTTDSAKKTDSQSKPNPASDSAKKNLSAISNKPKSSFPNKTKAWAKTPAKKQYKTPTYSKPKKKKKLSCLKILFILFLTVLCFASISGYVGYKGYESYKFIDKSRSLILNPPPEIKEKYTPNMVLKYDDDNFPLYARNFVPDKKLFEEISRIDTLVPRGKDLGNHFMEEKLTESIKSIIPQNIEEFRTQFASSIKQKMTETKKKSTPTYEESSDLPSSPERTTFRNTVRYWNLLSRYFDNKRDYDTSLLMVHSIFYLSKDFLTNYSSSGFISSRLISFINYSIACDSLLNWANKPKLNSHKLSKAVAKDILDFVDNEVAFTNLIKFEENSHKDHMKIIFRYFEDGRLSVVEGTEEYKDLLDFLYKKPQEFMDKPLYEMQNDLDKMEREIEQYVDKYNVSSLKSLSAIYKVILHPESFVVGYLTLIDYPNFKGLKKNYEEVLAKMEFTAIALAINSFYCEKSRLPGSIGELSNWFGRELPKNRLTNKPYNIDLDGEHLLYSEKGAALSEYFFDLAR